MGAFVFIILALGYLHASEAKEQFSLTDFLLDFLLSLWVPANYAPSNAVQSVADPAVREQMISIEKSKTALDNYIEHLLRYATENKINAINNAQTDQKYHLIPDSSQAVNIDLPFGCKNRNFECNYVDPDPNQLYPNSAVSPIQTVPYPEMISNQGFIPTQRIVPVQTVHPNQAPSPIIDDLMMIPSHGKLHPPEIQSARFQQTTHIRQPDYYPADLQNYQPLVNGDVTNSFPEWAPEGIPDSIASDEDVAECDPNVDPATYKTVYCTPLEIVIRPYLYHEVKRNFANPEEGKKQLLLPEIEDNSNPDVLKKPMSEIAEKIWFLFTDQTTPNGIDASHRMLTSSRQKPQSLPQKKLVQIRNTVPVNIQNIEDVDDKKEREHDIATDSAKDFETRIFEEWYLPHFLDDVLSRPYVQNIEPGPTTADVQYAPSYYDQQFNGYADSSVANKIADKNLNPRGSILEGLKHLSKHSQGRRGDGTPPYRSLISPDSTLSTTSDIVENKSEIVKPALLPVETNRETM